MKRQLVRSVVLTSTENFVWSSMQEIIPAIEKAWLRSASRNHLVRVIDVGREPLSSYLADVMQADHVVFTCFTMKLAKLGKFLRTDASAPGRYVTYLHNQATIACWPLFEWGPGALFTEDDVFISSSSFDARTFKLTFARGKVALHPFWLPEAPNDHSARPAKSEVRDVIPFVYSGRISSQKNLHTLIHAFAIVTEKEPKAELVIFGGEDGLGSPNMGTKDVGYLASLQALARRLKVDSRVEFTGHLSRDILHERLNAPHVLVSPSLHSDENFGMSALRSLCLGRQAVLSRWGGHADFAQDFATQIDFVPVRGSQHGPWIDPRELALAMLQANERVRGKAGKSARARCPKRYRVDEMALNIRELIATPRAKRARILEKSSLAESVLKSRAEMKIFFSYDDPRGHRFFSGYGMGRGKKVRSLSGPLEVVPWVSFGKTEIQIDDPHRGQWILKRKEKGSIELRDVDGQTHVVPAGVARELMESGWAFKI